MMRIDMLTEVLPGDLIGYWTIPMIGVAGRLVVSVIRSPDRVQLTCVNQCDCTVSVKSYLTHPLVKIPVYVYRP